jgi:hypothetical protein
MMAYRIPRADLVAKIASILAKAEVPSPHQAAEDLLARVEALIA